MGERERTRGKGSEKIGEGGEGGGGGGGGGGGVGAAAGSRGSKRKKSKKRSDGKGWGISSSTDRKRRICSSGNFSIVIRTICDSKRLRSASQSKRENLIVFSWFPSGPERYHEDFAWSIFVSVRVFQRGSFALIVILEAGEERSGRTDGGGRGRRGL